LFFNFAQSHVLEKQGKSLQLYSNWCDSPPVINGCITDKINSIGTTISGTTPTEWKDASVRQITLSDGNSAYLYLMNDANNLYVGLVYWFENNSNNNRVTLYFDQGFPNGNHNDNLDTNNDNMVSSNRRGGAWSPYDRYWNGSIWTNDTSINLDAAEAYFTNVYNWEFRIPINGGSQDLFVNGGTSSASGNELGFFLEIFKNGASPDLVYWNATNGNSNNANVSPGWADIRLGTSKKNFIFGTSNIPNGMSNPVINGTIGENEWRGYYEKNILLTNLAGDTKNAILYLAQNSTGVEYIYCGLRVYDTTQNSNDYCQIYQEQSNPFSSTVPRDFKLNNDYENALRVTNGTLSDRYFNNTGSGSWSVDPNGVGIQQGNSSYALGSNYWDYEFRIHYYTGSFYDLTVDDNSLIGFLISYHDEDMPLGRQNFWLESIANTDTQFVDSTSTSTNISIGWAYLQLGAPYLQVMYPSKNSIIEGTYPLCAYVLPADIWGLSISKVEYQIEGDSNWIQMTQISNTPYFVADFNTMIRADGTYELKIKAIDSSNIEIIQIRNITIQNNSTNNINLPTVTISTPNSGTAVSGSISINFTAIAVNPATIVSTEISFDGSTYTSATSPYIWDTTNIPNGSHIFRIKATDSLNKIGYSEIRLIVVDNAAPQSIGIIFPIQNSYHKGNLIIEALVADNLSIAKVEFWDGIPGTGTKLGEDIGSSNGWIYTWGTTSANDGIHNIYARAIDGQGNMLDSRSIIITIDNTTPTITNITLPLVNTYLKETFKIVANGTDAIGINRIVFYNGNPTANGILLGEDKTSPYEYIWTTNQQDDGIKNLYVRVYDNTENFKDSEAITITIDNTKPTVSTLTSPISGIYSGNLVLTAEATDINLDKVEFYKNGAKLGEDKTSPYTYTWNTINKDDGAHTLYVKAIDKSGNELASESIAITIDNTSPENCVITKPLPNSIHKGSLTIEASVADAIGIEKIEFYSQKKEKEETIIGLDTSKENGWKIVWDTLKIEDGLYDIYSIVYDQRNNKLVSNKVEITIDNTSPKIESVIITPLPVKVDKEQEVYVEKITLTIITKDETSGVKTINLKIINNKEEEFFKKEIVPVENKIIAYIPQLVEGSNNISIIAFDKISNKSETYKQTIFYKIPKNSDTIGINGGIIKSPDRTSIEIPINALQNDIKISIQTISPNLLVKPLDPQLKLVSGFRKIGPENLVFYKPVIITIPYTHSDIELSKDVSLEQENKLEIFCWEGQEWVRCGIEKRDVSENLISVKVNHLGIFGIGINLDPFVKKDKAFLTRNPFRLEDGTTFVIDLVKDSSITIKIYDIMGDLVRVLVKDKSERAGENNSYAWNGLNQFDNYVGSGIYIYRIEIKTDKEIKKFSNLIGVVK
ncbi:MAG: Ig-like domain-containing protein, partial [bacterium]